MPKADRGAKQCDLVESCHLVSEMSPSSLFYWLCYSRKAKLFFGYLSSRVEVYLIQRMYYIFILINIKLLFSKYGKNFLLGRVNIFTCVLPKTKIN